MHYQSTLAPHMYYSTAGPQDIHGIELTHRRGGVIHGMMNFFWLLYQHAEGMPNRMKFARNRRGEIVMSADRQVAPGTLHLALL